MFTTDTFASEPPSIASLPHKGLRQMVALLRQDGDYCEMTTRKCEMMRCEQVGHN